LSPNSFIIVVEAFSLEIIFKIETTCTIFNLSSILSSMLTARMLLDQISGLPEWITKRMTVVGLSLMNKTGLIVYLN